MSAFTIELNLIAAVGLAALLNTLWYAVAVVALTWSALRFSPGVNAAARYWIWTAVLGFLLVAPVLPGLAQQVRAALAAREQATAAAVAPLTRVPLPPTGFHQLAPILITVNTAPRPNRWPLCILAVWVFAAVWQLIRLLRGEASIRRLKARAEVASVGALPVTLRRPVRVLASTEVASPAAVGYTHPAVLVPPDLLTRLEEGEKRDVLLHELAHLERCDDWITLATHAVRAFLILHPLAAIVLRRIEREREMACDDFVVAPTGSAQSYARSLARLHDLRWRTGTRLLAPGIIGRNSSLGDRIESLLRHGREFSARASLASLGGSALLLAVLLTAGCLIPTWIAIAQTNTRLPKSFEVASIRPASPGNRAIGIYPRPGRFWATNIPLGVLIDDAYNLNPVQLQGLPRWARSRRYTIQAVMPPATSHLPPREMSELEAQMLQSLLADRFKLRVHRATKLLPVYDLVVAKGGPRMKPASDADYVRAHDKPGGSYTMILPGRYAALGASSERIAAFLTSIVGRQVIDKAGLTGRYDFNLTWTPWRSQASGMAGSSTPGGGEGEEAGTPPLPASSGLSIFTAIQQQLGLRLKPAKGPVKVLVVDHVEPPTPN